MAVDGARPLELLTSGTGIETYPVETAGGRVLFFSADAQRPPQLALLDGETSVYWTRRVACRLAAGIAGGAAQGDLSGRGWGDRSRPLFEPKNAAGKRPAVVYIHGGPQRQMLLGWHYMGYYANDYVVNQYLTSQGYVVLAVNYRLGIGYGHDYHFPPEAGVRGASEYRDIRAAGRYLQSLPNVGANRVGVYGGLYGGSLTAMALAHDSALFKAGVDVHGLHNRVLNMDTRTRYEAAPDAEEAMAVTWRWSPASAVATWKSPVLFIHGDDDRNVKFGQTVDLIQRLRGTGAHYETLVLVDETHSIHRHGNVLRMNDAVVEFLRRYLDR